jgi:hypothetical protein
MQKDLPKIKVNKSLGHFVTHVALSGVNGPPKMVDRLVKFRAQTD